MAALKIPASEFSSILKNDILYKYTGIAIDIINYACHNNDIGIFFCGGSSTNTHRYNQNAPTSIKFYIGNIKSKEQLIQFNKNIPHSAEIADNATFLKESLSRLSQIDKLTDMNRVYHLELVTCLLIDNLKFLDENNSPQQGREIFANLYKLKEEILPEVLSTIFVTKIDIENYFRNANFPLPTKLFENDPTNSLSFINKYDISTWSYDSIVDLFEDFYQHNSPKGEKLNELTNNAIYIDEESADNQRAYTPKKYDINKYCYYKNGDVWNLSFNGYEFSLKDSLGIHYIHQIIAMNGRELTPMDFSLPDPKQIDDGCKKGQKKYYNEEIVDVSLPEKFIELGKSTEHVKQASQKIDWYIKQLEGEYNRGEISPEDYKIELEKFKKHKEQLFDSSKDQADPNFKKSRDAVYKNIIRALSKIKKYCPEMHDHLLIIHKKNYNNTTYYEYRPAQPIHWILKKSDL